MGAKLCIYAGICAAFFYKKTVIFYNNNLTPNYWCIIYIVSRIVTVQSERGDALSWSLFELRQDV